MEMVDVRTRYPSFLKGSDMEEGEELELTIAYVKAAPDDYGKTVIVFDDDTTFSAGARQCRDIGKVLKVWETDQWAGRTIIVYSEKITITDKQTGVEKKVDTIRIKASPNDNQEVAKQKQATKPKDDDFGDQIPF
jgi:hypothetical protein